ncbi:MAG: AgmX/PglI C-terminal domain-containing protein, partial [Myxococcales bacterium]|nr:AgmX/PglI C-terminal domain-containing protein [Myxococcales bacterium]
DAELHAGDDLAGLPAIEPLAAPALAAPALAAPALAAPALAAPAAPSPPGAEPDRRRGIPIGAWIAIAAAVAFGAVFAQQLATRLLGPQPVAVAVPAPALPPEAPSAPRSDLALEEPEVLPGPSAAELAAEAAAAEAAATEAAAAEAAAAEAAATEAAATEAAATGSERPQARARAQTGAGASAAPERALSAEEQALLERFGGGTSAAAPSKIRVTGIEARGATQRGPLEGGDVRRVVSENRVSLQRCYNRAIRGLPQPPDARMDIEVRVGASGVVTNVNVEGEDFGGLVGCLRTTVRRWRFPASADGGETRFPVVFTGSG